MNNLIFFTTNTPTMEDILRAREEVRRLYRTAYPYKDTTLVPVLTKEDKIKAMWERSNFYKKYCLKVTMKTIKVKKNTEPHYARFNKRHDYCW